MNKEDSWSIDRSINVLYKLTFTYNPFTFVVQRRMEKTKSCCPSGPWSRRKPSSFLATLYNLIQLDSIFFFFQDNFVLHNIQIYNYTRDQNNATIEISSFRSKILLRFVWLCESKKESKGLKNFKVRRRYHSQISHRPSSRNFRNVSMYSTQRKKNSFLYIIHINFVIIDYIKIICIYNIYIQIVRLQISNTTTIWTELFQSIECTMIWFTTILFSSIFFFYRRHRCFAHSKRARVFKQASFTATTTLI